ARLHRVAKSDYRANYVSFRGLSLHHFSNRLMIIFHMALLVLAVEIQRRLTIIRLHLAILFPALPAGGESDLKASLRDCAE
ncbi:MAG: hypothetical protein DMG62_22355, partial [Acidobacteria bacterium]